MSANLCWKPVMPANGTLPDALKFILRDKCGLTSQGQTFTKEDLPYLRGLVDGGVAGAKELIELIEQYSEVFLWLEY